MIPVKSLELRMEAAIRAGLRKAMSKIDVRNIRDPLHEVEESLESSLYNKLYSSILTTYAEGYTAAGNLIRNRIGRKAAAVADTIMVAEDPRIAKATKSVIYGLNRSIQNNKNEIQATMRAGFEAGESIPHLTDRLTRYFDDNRASATRFARTVTNDVYNRAHLDRYEDSGVVDGVVFSAHIDDRTSDICRMLDGTIWALGDKDIQVPPMHFSCRSRLLAYMGSIPGKRDFAGEFGSDYVADATKVSTTFRSEYWNPMPHTKASATFQRSYFTKSDITTVSRGLNQRIKTLRTEKAVPDIVPLEHLKTLLRYRKIDPDKSIIADRFGKSLLLDKFEERDITNAIKSLITQTDGRITREAAKRTKLISDSWKEVLTARKGIVKLEKDVVYYRKRMAADPANAVEYQKIITADTKRINTLKTAEQRRIDKWNQNVNLKPSATTTSLEAEKERYEEMISGFDFKKR